ncbi:MmgE/PrpD family protein [Paralcaligenes sp. KSB-10]|uniref:MmgE/PrpD family protein n=1 Tax=Paralcaligenes sp. KSB-10 TaxID=2901142 RepID=UPI001E42BCD7|nr:MmgE/PrpD family protein [Paralcaligenes sp. KSB-10]UHL66056.1 MmgE/PrpD family protein [Paralcaligenes sp. KSB-10]
MLLQTLAQYGAQQSRHALAPDVAHHAKRALLDWLGALYPGTRVSPGRELLAAYKDELGLGASRLPGHRTTSLPATAAWINGSMSHAVEFDDIFKDAVYHPGCPVISASLAIADARNASGAELLNAIVVGYEISTRIGAAIQPSHYRFFHTTGTVGCIGAAAAVAALCAPGNATVMQHAIATACTFASGLQQAFRSDAMTKALHAGHAAAVGVRAGLAAAAGVTGVPDILEGDAGFGAALATNPNWAVATEGLGEHYNITRITQKNHGCCGHTFAAIDAALILKEKFNIAPTDIREIKVASYQVALDVTGNRNPTTAFEAKFSLAYVVCHALRFGSVRLNAFSAERLQNSDIRRLMAKLALVEDAGLSAAFPGQRAARVTIALDDGQSFEHFSPYRKGDPELPLSDQDLNEKFEELASPVLGPGAAAVLRNQIWDVDRLPVRELQLDSSLA